MTPEKPNSPDKLTPPDDQPVEGVEGGALSPGSYPDPDSRLSYEGLVRVVIAPESRTEVKDRDRAKDHRPSVSRYNGDKGEKRTRGLPLD